MRYEPTGWLFIPHLLLLVARCSILIACAAILLTSSCARKPPVPADTGLCYNGTFEEGSGGFVSGWSGTSGPGSAIEKSRDSHTGRFSVRLVSKAEGRARLEPIRVKQTAVRNGVVSFWYKAVSSDRGGRNLTLSVLPLEDDRAEGGAERATYVVPADHVRDGRWHRAEIAFDYLRNPAVTHSAVSVGVNDGPIAGSGEWIVDDITIARRDHFPCAELVIRGAAPTSGILMHPSGATTVNITAADSGEALAEHVVLHVQSFGVRDGKPTSLGAVEIPVGRLDGGQERTVAWKCKTPTSGWLVVLAWATGDYPDKNEKRRVGLASLRHSSWTPVRNRLASMRARGRSLSIGDGTRRVLLDREEEPPILRYFVNDGGWREVARSPWLVRIGAVGSALGSTVAEIESARTEDGRIRLTCGTPVGLEKVPWKADISLSCDSVRQVFDLECKATPRRTVSLRVFEFPEILVGEGTTGEQKSSAIFPGLEFLRAGERSSGKRDITSRQSERWTPNPLRVTLPIMAVATEKAAIGLAWDVSRSGPTPVFASPNFLDQQLNHRLGLMLPTVPEFTPEGWTQAMRPARVAGPVVLRGHLFLEPKASALDVVGKWVGVFGDLRSAKAPRSYQDELLLCAKAFNTTAWVERYVGWVKDQNSEPRAYPDIALSALRLSREASNPNTSKSLRAKVERVIRTHGKDMRDVDLAFAVGGVRQSVEALRNEALEAVRKQERAGEWTFQPERGTASLGKRGGTNIGICATAALPVLRYAELTGEPWSMTASAKALRYVDRFEVPAGAQMWEIPLDAPDLLASAKAVQAYLSGYRATGNRHYLDKARYWAWTGVPFIYLWSAPGRYAMKGASAPVFGATFFTSSWTGKAVQWNGLEYADAILDLSKHDKSFEWKTLAETVTVSAMMQQETRGTSAGLFPDALDMIENHTVTPLLSPQAILRNVWKLRGRSWSRTFRIAGGHRDVRVTLAGGATCRREGRDLRVTFSRTPLLGSDYVFISPTRPPSSVACEEGPLPRVADLALSGSGWEYDPVRGWLVVKVMHSGRRSVLIKGVFE